MSTKTVQVPQLVRTLLPLANQLALAVQAAHDPEARFVVTEIADDLAVKIERDGLDATRQSFEIKNGYVFETTEGVRLVG